MIKRTKLNFLDYKRNTFSQNGEDGIIEKIFDIIGTGNKIACEFGAWDGIYLSNTRNLVLKGWTSVFIEGNQERFKKLVNNYKNNPNVYCVNRYVDTKKNSLSNILTELRLVSRDMQIDFLSIDIDGLDYEIFRHLTILPRVICIEVNAGHYPESKRVINRTIAKDIVGQPLSYFSRTARKMGYSLVCFSGNAFYVKNEVLKKYKIESLTNLEAYNYFIDGLDQSAKEWLFLVNNGLVLPYYKFNNPFLSEESLSIGNIRKNYLYIKSKYQQLKHGHFTHS